MQWLRRATDESAKRVMMEGDFDERDFRVLRYVVSRLGLADAKAFGMTWEDCEDFLSKLGYRVSVAVSEAPAMVSAG